MIVTSDLPDSYIRELEGMTSSEIAVAAATYRSSCPRKGIATHLILRWFRLKHSRKEYEDFLLLYAGAWEVVKVQRRLNLANRPESRPVIGRRHQPVAVRHGFALASH